MLTPTDIKSLQRDALAWAQRAAALGWLNFGQVAQFATLEQESPDTLFEGSARRPLVVAFFGGTGVGKSTLLNRLAGQEVARTGVVRPTSREISVYLHESVRLKPLPAHLPVDRVQMVFHRSEAYRDVLWVDMPDFDSTDHSNHDLAIKWLPHIDVLIYVVSPERYRDDRGWRMLLQHESDHAWIFVINQWDRGHPAQMDDFRQLLRLAGFEDPLVFGTDSRPETGSHDPDDFQRVADTIRGLADQRVMDQLTQHTLNARVHAVADLVSGLGVRIGDETAFRQLKEAWTRIWGDTERKLRKGLEWPINEFVDRFVSREADPLRRTLDLAKVPANGQPTAEAPVLTLIWDDWAQLCFDDAIDRLLVECDELGQPSAALRDTLQPLRGQASRWALDRGQMALRDALARPGSRGQRWALKLMGLLSVIAPLGAIGWVAYEVVVTYYRSVQTQTLFLGTEFAIHSGLLILIAWLLPYFAQLKLKPSTEKAARRGLQRGLEESFAVMREAVADRIEEVEASGAALRREGLALVGRGASAAAPETPVPDGANFRRTMASSRR